MIRSQYKLRWMSVEEAAERLSQREPDIKSPYQIIYRAIHADILPCRRLKGGAKAQYIVHVSDLREFLDDREGIADAG